MDLKIYIKLLLEFLSRIQKMDNDMAMNIYIKFSFQFQVKKMNNMTWHEKTTMQYLHRLEINMFIRARCQINVLHY